jgi:hypothetical protein
VVIVRLSLRARFGNMVCLSLLSESSECGFGMDAYMGILVGVALFMRFFYFHSFFKTWCGDSRSVVLMH